MPPRALLTLSVLPDRFAVCRLDGKAPVPPWAAEGSFTSITRSQNELSIICAESNVPVGTNAVSGWRALKCEGPLDFALTGIVASLAEPLADAGIAIFPVATHDTDYVLLKESQLDLAVHALTAYGHVVRT